MNTQNRSTRLLTKKTTAAILSAAQVPALGANKFRKIGNGNTFSREDGTLIRIFNVQAFASLAKKQEAQAHWLKGVKLENSGDLQGAQEHYKAARNCMMSFSVLDSNAAAYQGAYDITGIVTEVPTREDASKMTLGINFPKPVAVAENFISDNVSFEEPVEEEKPAATPKARKAAGAKA